MAVPSLHATHSCGGAPARCASAYELESPARRFLGSVNVSHGEWWSGAITLPDDASDIALVELTRHGGRSLAVESICATVPASELPALATLFSGLVGEAVPR